MWCPPNDDNDEQSVDRELNISKKNNKFGFETNGIFNGSAILKEAQALLKSDTIIKPSKNPFDPASQLEINEDMPEKIIRHLEVIEANCKYRRSCLGFEYASDAELIAEMRSAGINYNLDTDIRDLQLSETWATRANEIVLQGSVPILLGSDYFNPKPFLENINQQEMLENDHENEIMYNTASTVKSISNLERKAELVHGPTVPRFSSLKKITNLINTVENSDCNIYSNKSDSRLVNCRSTIASKIEANLKTNQFKTSIKLNKNTNFEPLSINVEIPSMNQNYNTTMANTRYYTPKQLYLMKKFTT